METVVDSTPPQNSLSEPAPSAVQLPVVEPEVELDDSDLEYVTGGLARAWIDGAILPFEAAP